MTSTAQEALLRRETINEKFKRLWDITDEREELNGQEKSTNCETKAAHVLATFFAGKL